MLMRNESPILVAEPIAEAAAHLERSLGRLGFLVRLAGSTSEALEVMRRQLLTEAIVAVELAIGSQSLLERLGRLPALELLMATGPRGAPKMEVRARRAGAQLYLPRPVDVAALAAALSMSRSHVALAGPP
jgi:ActR/RegA family two-component response regulator